jgi:hypothetical protein
MSPDDSGRSAALKSTQTVNTREDSTENLMIGYAEIAQHAV